MSDSNLLMLFCQIFFAASFCANGGKGWICAVIGLVWLVLWILTAKELKK